MSETALSRSAIYSARPTLRIAGQEDERMTALLTSMRMEEGEGGMSRLELRVANWAATDGHPELAFDASSQLKLGAELSVHAGDAAAPREIFAGKVSALEMVCNYGGPPELVVLAEDALTAARRARRTKVYAAMSPADVVSAIAGDLGLTPSVSGLSSPQGTWAQLDETDMAFLRRLLARFDADLQVVGTRLQVAPRKDVQRGTIDLALYGQLTRVRLAADLAHQPTAVTVTGWNAEDGSAVKGEASAIANAGPGRGKSGVAWAQEVFGTRSEHLPGPAVFTTDEARAVAEAALDQRARRFVCAEGLAVGNAQLRVGSCVRLAGVSAQFDNTYYVVRACHLYDMKQGYVTEFGAECAYLGQ